MTQPTLATLIVLTGCLIPAASPTSAQQSSSLRQLFENVQESAAESPLLGKISQGFNGNATEDGNGAAAGVPSSAPQTNQGAAQESGASMPLPPPQNLPEPRVEGRLPLAGSQAGDNVRLSQTGDGLITLVVRDAALSKVLALIAQHQHLNIVTSDAIDKTITISLYNVPLEDALTSILSVANYTWVRRNDIILITSLADAATLPASVQGRQIQVFELDFAKASAVAEAISNTGFLSPVGKVSISASDSTDNRRTREIVVVEDLPESLSRVAAYVNYVDQPPRQVQIEAHILQVKLDDTNSQGVNLDGLVRLVNPLAPDKPLLTLKTGFAEPVDAGGFVATLDGADLGTVIKLLQETNDTKSLGSPKLLVLNEQEAEFQVGRKLGYKTTTTTETSSLETIQFLNVGVVLTVTPRITRDGRVLMHVAPKVSDGAVNDNGLPNEETTELYTDVILENGQGMIIGGLITEEDSVSQSKIPYLGDVKGLGWFFRRSEVIKERIEIIIALVPRIQPYDCEYQAFEQGELVKASVPLLDGPLHRTNRPWDPVLADGVRHTRPLLPHKPLWEPEHPRYPQHMHYYVPRHPLPEQVLPGEACEPMFEDSPSPVPFLSDEVLPPPPHGGPNSQTIEIISDQP